MRTTRAFLSPFVVFAVLLLLSGCGNSNPNHPVQVTGTSVMLQTGDAINDQILTGSGGTPNTSNLLSAPAEVEFTHSAGTMEPLTLAHISQGTYSGATLTVSNPEVVAIIAGVPTKLTATLTSTTVNVTFSPSITIGTSPMFLNFDLDLANSITITGTSASVSPKFNVTTSTIAPEENEDEDNGEIEDVHGSVTNITAPNFTIQTRTTTITFATDANTRFREGITQLSDLKVGDIVEVDGVTKSDGTKLATKVEREGDQNAEEVEGLISALDNPLTKITIVHQLDSTKSTTAPVTVDIGVNSSTVFSVRTDKLSITAPAFSPCSSAMRRSAASRAAAVHSDIISKPSTAKRSRCSVTGWSSTTSPTRSPIRTASPRRRS